MNLPRVAKSRRVLQWAATILVLGMGLQFTVWIWAHLAGRPPGVPRPAGVEAFLPINSMLGLRHFLSTGSIDPIHPAGLAIFIAICLVSWVFARSFCSHICPAGLLSELLGRWGTLLTRRQLRFPRWVDIPLRSVKWLLLAFFVWAIWFAMSPGAVASFLESPYARVADAKMWLFFAQPSRTTLVVMGFLFLASLFVRDFWCRYLCPYGALLGMLGRFAPLKVTRDPEICEGCEGCTQACPAALPVHQMTRVSSVECTSCLDCVVACPVPSCLEVRPPRRLVPRFLLRPAAVAGLAALLYVAVVMGFRITGHWHTAVTDEEYHYRLREIHAPHYEHPR